MSASVPAPMRVPSEVAAVDPAGVVAGLPVAERVAALRGVFDLALEAASCDPTDPVRAVAALGRAALADGGPDGLLAAIGLAGRLGLSPRRALALRDRDVLIRAAVAANADWAGRPSAAVAHMLSAAFRRYEADVWPRERRRSDAPSDPVRAAYWRILRGDMKVPATAQHLARIIEHGDGAD